MSDNKVWANALEEVESPTTRDAGLWARCYAESDGDEAKAKAAYVRSRVGSNPSLPGDMPSAKPETASKTSEEGGSSIWYWIFGIPVALFLFVAMVGVFSENDPKAYREKEIASFTERCIRTNGDGKWYQSLGVDLNSFCRTAASVDWIERSCRSDPKQSGCAGWKP